MYQEHSFRPTRLRNRQNRFYQPYPTYNPFTAQQSTAFQNQPLSNTSMYQHPYQQSFEHQYQQPYQNTYQPLFGNGSNEQMNNPFMNTYTTPYPKQPPFTKQQPSGFQTVISQFKKSDGQLDINKMMDTAGQMMSAVNQMGGLFKGVTSIFK